MESQELIKQYLHLILYENGELADRLDMKEIDSLRKAVKAANRVFLMGAGRSGLVLRMAAMRMMHLGLNVFMVGDTLTPAIAEGDVLLVASGSGTTTSVINVVEKAKDQKVKVIGLTVSRESRLAILADEVINVPAATKTDFGILSSEQYAGSLFEQAVLFIFEAVFMALWKESGLTKEYLWSRHANLE
ncbi:6-phospho-3-hexuloisomerase [Chryseobacterium sp.]|uniref:6-phospho-3-hexuloisomerase n=1 Tax=Chryseobacterium sp. TaxID=1871047 RepID=UPI0025BDAED8|nr:6-phospho-3-hexuloisomerase [Chryseobacterium sp.]